jgi:uncharacterized paraquat-inducible protein A
MITAIKTCPECEGEKTYTHPRWVRYWEEHDREDRKAQSYENMEAWFLQNYGIEPHDEEIGCPTCNATGEIREETTLREALTEIELTAAIIAAETSKAVLAKG